MLNCNTARAVAACWTSEAGIFPIYVLIHLTRCTYIKYVGTHIEAVSAKIKGAWLAAILESLEPMRGVTI